MAKQNNVLAVLDRIDKALSRPLFQLCVPYAWIEYVWSVPGNWFGIPFFTLTVVPPWILWCKSSRNSTAAGAAASLLLCVMLILWRGVLQGNRRIIRCVYGPVLAVSAPYLGWAIIHFVCSHDDDDATRSAQAHAFYFMANWCWAVIPVAILKPTMARTRPCCCIEDGAPDDKKHIAMLPRLFSHDAHTSFPSGDSAGAAASLLAWIRILVFDKKEGTWIVAGAMGIGWILFIGSLTGRVYWKAHHLGDVFVGALLGLGASLLWAQWCFYQEKSLLDINGRHVVVAHTTLAFVSLVMRHLCSRKGLLAGTIHVHPSNLEDRKRTE